MNTEKTIYGIEGIDGEFYSVMQKDFEASILSRPLGVPSNIHNVTLEYDGVYYKLIGSASKISEVVAAHTMATKGDPTIIADARKPAKGCIVAKYVHVTGKLKSRVKQSGSTYVVQRKRMDIIGNPRFLTRRITTNRDEAISYAKALVR